MSHVMSTPSSLYSACTDDRPSRLLKHVGHLWVMEVCKWTGKYEGSTPLSLPLAASTHLFHLGRVRWTVTEGHWTVPWSHQHAVPHFFAAGVSGYFDLSLFHPPTRLSQGDSSVVKVLVEYRSKYEDLYLDSQNPHRCLVGATVHLQVCP